MLEFDISPSPTLLAEEMAEDMRLYIGTKDNVTFAELSRRYGDDAAGTESLTFTTHPRDEKHRLILWANMSYDFVDAVQAGFQAGYFHPEPTIDTIGGMPLVYLLDGECLKIPIPPARILNAYRKGTPLKKDYWAPMILRPGTHCEDRKKCAAMRDEDRWGMSSEEVVQSQEIIEWIQKPRSEKKWGHYWET